MAMQLFPVPPPSYCLYPAIRQMLCQMASPDNPAATATLSGKEAFALSETGARWDIPGPGAGALLTAREWPVTPKGLSVKFPTQFRCIFPDAQDPACQGYTVKPGAQIYVTH